MNDDDERMRDAIHDALTRANIDARSLSIEVRAGAIEITGTVPTEEQRRQVAPVAVDAAMADRCRIDIGVRPVAPIDSGDGRGRSPATGTSADSEHESKHQTDR
ncbi:MAG: BON domain-containing protein [Enhydrobacter sp.]|nr:MAG: BON domain-containing protein [Enhydrobacter sp.]